MKLSVIIVSYNVKYYVEQCLRAVFKAGEGLEMEVFVTDNAGSDDTPAYISERFPAVNYPELHIINNARNLGFGKANNRAATNAKGEYLLFLNPDTIVAENTLHDAIKYADEHPEAGGIGTMMLNSNGSFAPESRRGLPTPWTSFCKMSGLCKLFPKSRLFGNYYMQYLNRDKAAKIEIVSGAFFMARRSVLDKTGIFDEAFFMYGEDIDLSYRILQSGNENHYIPSPILHYKGESTQKSTFKYVHIFYNAMLIFFKKHYHHYGILMSLPIKAAILLRATIAVMAQYATRARNFVIPPRDTQDGEYIYIGRNGESIKTVAEKWCLNIHCIEDDEMHRPTPSLPPYKQKKTCIIFDTDDFSYGYILEAFRNSSHTAKAGTFYPDEGIIITPDDIFTL